MPYLGRQLSTAMPMSATPRLTRKQLVTLHILLWPSTVQRTRVLPRIEMIRMIEKAPVHRTCSRSQGPTVVIFRVLDFQAPSYLSHFFHFIRKVCKNKNFLKQSTLNHKFLIYSWNTVVGYSYKWVLSKLNVLTIPRLFLR